ncbi:MAG: FKBP-type peptidyl-prolyl cis-trans isomerase N-terminal domain-containing protein, partial [Bacteroides sp.]
MKSLKLGAVALAATVGLSACSTGVPAGQAKMDNKLDSISYAIGMTQFPAQMKSGIEQQLGEDVMADVIKGVKDGYKSTSKKEKAYALGVNIGQAIDDIAKGVNQNVFGDEEANKINKANILAALLDALQGNEPKIEDIQSILTEENFNTLKEEYSETAYADLKKENEDFLAENAKKEGVVVTESGLQYKVIESGDGEAI